VALFMIASLAGFPMTPRAPLSGVMQGEGVDVPEAHELALISRRTDGDDGPGAQRSGNLRAPPPIETTEPPPSLLPSPRCARSIGHRPARSGCVGSARGPPCGRDLA